MASKDFDEFLEVVYRALMMIIRWIEKRRSSDPVK